MPLLLVAMPLFLNYFRERPATEPSWRYTQHIEMNLRDFKSGNVNDCSKEPTELHELVISFEVGSSDLARLPLSPSSSPWGFCRFSLHRSFIIARQARQSVQSLAGIEEASLVLGGSEAFQRAAALPKAHIFRDHSRAKPRDV